MIVKHKLDKSFGPSGTFAGYVLVGFGLLTIYSSWIGLILVLIGAFIGFSSTGSVIDTDKKRIKFSNNLFGFIKTGKWVDIDPSMKVGVKESNVTWTTFSSSNRSIDTVKKDFRIVLCDAEENEIMEISKSNSVEDAMSQLEIIGKQLALSSF
jgi:hypothetical protein